MRFLDTNVVLRYLTGDDEVKAAAQLSALPTGTARIEEELFACEAVVSERCVRALLAPYLPTG